jgi:hypothetical protein
MPTSNSSSREANASVPAVDTASSSGSDTQQQVHPKPPSSKNAASATSNRVGKKRTVYLACAFCCCLLVLVGAVIIVLMFTSNVFEIESSFLERAPTLPLDASPTGMPRDIPSMLPSHMPSSMPSDGPSTMPSEGPSYQPSESPSSAPSTMPTSVFVKPNSVPNNPKEGYFNYDRMDSRYGPDAWGKVDTSDNFMKEFGPNGWGPFRGMEGEDIVKNRCSSRSDNLQSPRNVSPTVPCEALHEIRTWVRRGKMESSLQDGVNEYTAQVECLGLTLIAKSFILHSVENS